MHDSIPSLAPGPLAEYYHVVRTLGPPDTVFPSLLVRAEHGGLRVLVGVDHLIGWHGWRAEPDGHLLGPGDVVATADGPAAELPWCTEGVDAFLARRSAARRPLSDGEGVTLGVSILRGLAELEAARARGEGLPRGRWWLTDEGRPLFAPEPTAEHDADQASRLTLQAAARACADGAVAVALRAALDESSSPGRVRPDAEDDLFALAEPAPLQTHEPTLEPVRVAALRDASFPAAPAEPPPRSLLHAVAERVLDTELLDMLAEPLRRVRADRRGRTEPTRRSRRGPALAAAAVVVVAVVGALVWPSADPQPAQGADDTAVAPSPTPELLAGPRDDRVADAAAILASLRDCTDDACRRALLDDPAALAAARTVWSGVGRPVLLDDFGDVAVLRLDPVGPDGAVRRIVIARSEDAWRLRAVYEEKT